MAIDLEKTTQSTVRFVQTMIIRHGRFPQFLEALKELREFHQRNQLTPIRTLAVRGGACNKVILEAEYPSFAALEQDTNQFAYNREHFRLRENLAANAIEGSIERDFLVEISPG
jgi:hypothetical protein